MVKKRKYRKRKFGDDFFLNKIFTECKREKMIVNFSSRQTLCCLIFDV